MITVMSKQIKVVVGVQYIEEKWVEYSGYKNKSFRLLPVHLSAWTTINNKEKHVIKDHFINTWSKIPNSTFVYQLDIHQRCCIKLNVTVSSSDKVDHFVKNMNASKLFETNLLSAGNLSVISRGQPPKVML